MRCEVSFTGTTTLTIEPYQFFTAQSLATVMEVVCLNGLPVKVDPSKTLQNAKIQVAKALGAFPEAVWILCRGQVLTTLSETLEMCLAKLEADVQEPLFGVLDHERMKLASALRVFEPELEACERKRAQNEKMSAELEQKKSELAVYCCSPAIYDIEKKLKEGNLSLQKEKALVFRHSKLQRLQRMEEKLFQATDHLYVLRNRLQQKISQARIELQTALDYNGEAKELQLLAEFDEMAEACKPRGWAYAFSEASSDLFWDFWDEVEADYLRLFFEFREPEELNECNECRLLRREDGRNGRNGRSSKRSWKFKVKTGTSQASASQLPRGKCESDGERLLPKCARRRCYRRVMSQDVRNQLQEYCVYGPN